MSLPIQQVQLISFSFFKPPNGLNFSTKVKAILLFSKSKQNFFYLCFLILIDKMKYFSVIFLFFSLSFSALLARESVENQTYWIEFKDKGDVREMLSSPQYFLSQKAIDRRQKLKIPISENDLPVNERYLEQLQQQGGKVVGVSRWLNGVLLSVNDEATIKQIEGLSFVKEEVKRNPPPKKAKPLKPVDCGKGQINIPIVEDFDSLYGNAYCQLSFFHGNQLHINCLRGSGVVIAVIDEGFYGVDVHPAFDSLRLSGRLLGYKDFTGMNGELSTHNSASHGAKTLSCLAANFPGKFVGTAPEASYWLLSSEYTPEESPLEEYYWVFAAEFADSVGVDIISSSLGYSRFDNSKKNYTYNDFYKYRSPASKAAAYAWEKGIVVVASAGNEGQSSWQYLLFPGETPEIITIGSVDKDGKVSDFSSRGYWHKSIIKPDFVALGDCIYLADGEEGYVFLGGTSFAAPLVSGLIACCLQSNPLLTNNEIKRLLIETAIPPPSKPNRCYGYGIPNFGRMMERINDISQKNN